MANSKYEYVRAFEQPDILLPQTWIVVRIDGRGFHKFSDRYQFKKPNDRQALDLMNTAAVEVMKDLPDLNIAYGVSDEYSFIFHPNCQLFERRSEKLVSTIVSSFTAHYIHNWPTFFPDTPLESSGLPTFDGRAVIYPSTTILRDYMNWRQVDCHINNLYNTAFWTMVQKGGMSNTDAEKELQGTVSSDKNEILFSRFGINYNNEPEIFRKGSVVYRQFELQDPHSIGSVDDGSKVRTNSPISISGEDISRTQREKAQKLRRKAKVVVEHVDIIKDDFWKRRPWILSNKPGRLPPQD